MHIHMVFSKKTTPPTHTLHPLHSTELFKIFFSLLTLSIAFLQKACGPGKMHVHNTVSVYVNLLLHLCGIKVIIKCSLWLQCSAYRCDLSWTTTFTKYSREKGAIWLQHLFQIMLLLHFHNKDFIQYQTFSSQSKIRIRAFISMKCISGFVLFKWKLLNHNLEQTECRNG